MLKLIMLLSMGFFFLVLNASGQSSQSRKVVINGTSLGDATIQALEQAYRVQIIDGSYWYDKACGAWGFVGGPTAGFILPGLDLGGALRADASNGNTGVFINGRQLHMQDVVALRQLIGVVYQGRYWLDAYGNVGQEGGPVLLNLAVLAQQAGGRGNAFYRSGNTGIGAGSSGGTSYVMGKDWSVIIDN